MAEFGRVAATDALSEMKAETQLTVFTTSPVPASSERMGGDCGSSPPASMAGNCSHAANVEHATVHV